MANRIELDTAAHISSIAKSLKQISDDLRFFRNLEEEKMTMKNDKIYYADIPTRFGDTVTTCDCECAGKKVDS